MGTLLLVVFSFNIFLAPHFIILNVCIYFHSNHRSPLLADHCSHSHGFFHPWNCYPYIPRGSDSHEARFLQSSGSGRRKVSCWSLDCCLTSLIVASAGMFAYDVLCGWALYFLNPTKPFKFVLLHSDLSRGDNARLSTGWSTMCSPLSNFQ